MFIFIFLLLQKVEYLVEQKAQEGLLAVTLTGSSFPASQPEHPPPHLTYNKHRLRAQARAVH